MRGTHDERRATAVLQRLSWPRATKNYRRKNKTKKFHELSVEVEIGTSDEIEIEWTE